ncbi:MAG: helix-turn-helix transcriptional regulator [Aeriscardovia sp.]|nr:helix-turn-helix transcriptional regulator [Aeriscardovia sp.]
MNYKVARWNLDALLEENGISKTQLSYRAEVSHTQINRICKGETTRIDLATLARICTVLNCEASDIIKIDFG